MSKLTKFEKGEKRHLRRLGKFLIYCRTSVSRIGLSRQQVAERMGNSVRFIRALERGEVDVRLSTLRRYFTAIECLGSYEVRGISKKKKTTRT